MEAVDDLIEADVQDGIGIGPILLRHNPMCSWCWASAPAWSKFGHQPKGVEQVYVLGELAPNSDESMPKAMQSWLQNTGRGIQKRDTGAAFNFHFWGQCQPRSSTSPACRAMILINQMLD